MIAGKNYINEHDVHMMSSLPPVCERMLLGVIFQERTKGKVTCVTVEDINLNCLIAFIHRNHSVNLFDVNRTAADI